MAPHVGDDTAGYCHACQTYTPPTDGATPWRQGARPPRPTPPPGPTVTTATPWEHVATYDYYDEAGKVLYCVDRYTRTETRDDGTTATAKTFRQRPAAIARRQKTDRDRTPVGASMDGVRMVLYELPSILSAIQQGGRIWVVEGEKCADKLNDWFRHETGSIDRATTSPGGAGSWRDDYADSLRGGDVLVWPDDDEPGRRHADTVAASLRGVSRSVAIIPIDRLPGVPHD